MQGELHLPYYVFPQSQSAAATGGSLQPPVTPIFPTRDIQLIVPTSAGGGNDAIARTLARNLGPLLGQTVHVDNRAGGGGAYWAEAPATNTAPREKYPVVM